MIMKGELFGGLYKQNPPHNILISSKWGRERNRSKVEWGNERKRGEERKEEEGEV